MISVSDKKPLLFSSGFLFHIVADYGIKCINGYGIIKIQKNRS